MRVAVVCLVLLSLTAGCVIQNAPEPTKATTETVRFTVKNEGTTPGVLGVRAADTDLGAEFFNVTLSLAPGKTTVRDFRADPTHGYQLIVVNPKNEDGTFRTIPANSCTGVFTYAIVTHGSAIQSQEASCDREAGA